MPCPRHHLTHQRKLVALQAVMMIIMFIPFISQARTPFDAKPISYSTAPVTDDISTLQKEIDSGKVKLKFDEKHGYLISVLEHLKIPHSSQSLVFSKTSFQRPHISSKKPRAIYFSDDVYIGWVQNGDVMEVSTSDPQLGAIFYTLEQKKTDKPKFQRQVESCMLCHSSSFGHRVPAHVIRSVFPNRGGFPFVGSYTFRTTDKSPLKERFGGWYVSGTHGKKHHMGNKTFFNNDDIKKTNHPTSSNIVDLSKLFDVQPYLTPHSDIVAQLVLTHQATMHNQITIANYRVRKALHAEKILQQKEDAKQKDIHNPDTLLIIDQAADALVKYMLFADAVPLQSKIKGTSHFQKEFTSLGKRDKQGHSLREFDLKTRLFKYPCSFLIHSDSFDGLPKSLKKQVYHKLRSILLSKEKSKDYLHINPKDKKTIYTILLETKKDFAK